jgi:hypothetical protein
VAEAAPDDQHGALYVREDAEGDVKGILQHISAFSGSCFGMWIGAQITTSTISNDLVLFYAVFGLVLWAVLALADAVHAGWKASKK